MARGGRAHNSAQDGSAHAQGKRGKSQNIPGTMNSKNTTAHAQQNTTSGVADGEQQFMQALVLADSFDTRFSPATAEVPRALLHLAGIPLIEYTLECLAAAHIDEVIVFCCAHAMLLEAYFKARESALSERDVANRHSFNSSNTGGLRRSTSSVGLSPGGSISDPHRERMRVRVISSPVALGVGDALREMDRNGLLKGDFVLLQGDVVSNVDVGKVLAAHRERRLHDKNAIMTMVLKPGTPRSLHHLAKQHALQHHHHHHGGHVAGSNIHSTISTIINNSSSSSSSSSGGKSGKSTVAANASASTLTGGPQPQAVQPQTTLSGLRPNFSDLHSPTLIEIDRADDIVIAIDTATNQLMYYNNASSEDAVRIGPEVFQSATQIEVRNDLIDCRIDICSPEVLALFTDEFDYQDLRQDFVQNVVTPDTEGGGVHGYKVFTHIIAHEYARRVKGISEYYAVTRDILHRWAYPMTLDNNLLSAFEAGHSHVSFPGEVSPGGASGRASAQLQSHFDRMKVTQTSFSLQRGMIYKEQGVQIARTANLREEVALGSLTVIEDHAHIAHSVVGRRCHIGSGARLTGCFIWDDVFIGEGCIVERGAILCSGVRLLPGTRVGSGSMLSFGVAAGPDVTIEPGTHLTRLDYSGLDRYLAGVEDSHAMIDVQPGDRGFTTKAELGEGGFGFRWHPPAPEASNDSEGEGWPLAQSAPIGDSADMDLAGRRAAAAARGDRTGTSAGNRDEAKFMRECREIILGSFHSGHSDVETKLELKGRQLAYDMQEIEVATAVLRTMLEYVLQQAFKKQRQQKADKLDPNWILAEAKQVFTKHGEGLVGAFSEIKDHAELVDVVMEYSVAPENAPLDVVFPGLLHAMYEADVIEEDGVFAWESDVKADQAKLTEDEKRVFAACAGFFDWLRESEDESGSEEETDSE